MRCHAHLLAHAIADVVEIFRLKEVGRGPLLDPVLVVGVVVQREDGLDAFPLALLGGDASTTLGGRVCDELVNDSQAFGFVERLGFQGFACFLGRCSRANTVNPVAHPA